MTQKRKNKEINAVPLIIWSVINILISSFLFAIPGLVFAIKYKQQGKEEIFNLIFFIKTKRERNASQVHPSKMQFSL